MVIDKTTGRGCALSMASKIIAEKLIADGIVGKTIYRKHRLNSKSIYDLFQVVRFKDKETVYVISQKSREPKKEPLWTPSFIDAGVWGQAVCGFLNLDRLDESVERSLLPMMDEFLQSVSDTELISLTRNFLIEHGIINTPICQHTGNTYYFSESEVYSLDKKSELFPYEGRQKFNIFQIKGEPCFNMNVWRKAASQFEVGMKLEDCIGIFLQTELVHNVPKELPPIDRLVQGIAPPIYERVPGNNNEATFDRIRIIVGVPRYQFNSWEALRNEVNKYQPEIYQRVIERLEGDRQFKKYGVPINFLKLSNVMLLRNFSIEFVFELKEIKDQNLSWCIG